ncbi:MAG: hypothetical protein ABSH42_10780 [Bryobacteraceae bacterium]|jgi:hypothetical protein
MIAKRLNNVSLKKTGVVENDAYLTYLGSKSLLFNAAQLGYGSLN